MKHPAVPNDAINIRPTISRLILIFMIVFAPAGEANVEVRRTA